MIKFARRATAFGIQTTLFGLAMMTFALGAVYQKLTEGSERSGHDDEESAPRAPSADLDRSSRSDRAAGAHPASDSHH